LCMCVYWTKKENLIYFGDQPSFSSSILYFPSFPPLKLAFLFFVSLFLISAGNSLDHGSNLSNNVVKKKYSHGSPKHMLAFCGICLLLIPFTYLSVLVVMEIFVPGLCFPQIIYRSKSLHL